MDGPRRFSNSPGCLNPLCPSANWSDGSLPRWWLRLDDGGIVEFAACDEPCAREGAHFVSARLGRPRTEFPIGAARGAAAVH